MYEVSPAPFRLNPSPPTVSTSSSTKRKPVMSKEAKQAIQYAEKLKSTSSPVSDTNHKELFTQSAPFSSVPVQHSHLVGTTPWQQNHSSEEGGVRMSHAPVSEPFSPPIVDSSSSSYIPASSVSSYPRAYPYTNSWPTIPDPVPVEQFPRLSVPYQSVTASTPSSTPAYSSGLAPSTSTLSSGPSGPTLSSDIAHQLAQIQLELANLREMDTRSSYAMEEFIICVGMGVGILLLLDKVAT